MNDPRIATIRCVMLTALGAVLSLCGWLEAGATLAALGLFMPVFTASCLCGGGGCVEPSGPTACEVQAVISGISDANADCGDCANFNGTYVLSKIVIPGTTSSACQWRYRDGDRCIGKEPGVPGGPVYYVDELNLATTSGGGSYVSLLRWWDTSLTLPAYGLRWQKTDTVPHDCINWDTFEIPWNLDDSPACQSDGTSAYLTKLS